MMNKGGKIQIILGGFIGLIIGAIWAFSDIDRFSGSNAPTPLAYQGAGVVQIWLYYCTGGIFFGSIIGWITTVIKNYFEKLKTSSETL